jgi:hypothetical protein
MKKVCCWTETLSTEEEQGKSLMGVHLREKLHFNDRLEPTCFNVLHKGRFAVVKSAFYPEVNDGL